jgi:hypothetical protein
MRDLKQPTQAGETAVDILPGRALLPWVLVAALVVAIIAVILIKSWPSLYPTVSDWAPLNGDCDLRLEPCRVRFDTGAEVELDIQPRGIPAVQPLELRVTLIGTALRPQQVEVDFVGVEMAMGFNRATLRAETAPGVWSGQGMLPVCVRDQMTWEARVLLHEQDRLLAAPFRFVSRRPGAP